MGVLKWLGYGLAAIIVLTVIVGGGLLVAAIVAIGAAVLCFTGLVVFVAVLIKDFHDHVRSSRR